MAKPLPRDTTRIYFAEIPVFSALPKCGASENVNK
jgi:hypothetical protein